MKRRYLLLLIGMIFVMSGCGKVSTQAPASSTESNTAAEEISADTGAAADSSADSVEADSAVADETGLFPIDEWEDKWAAKYGKDEFSKEEFDRAQYEETVEKSKVDEAVTKSSSLVDEMKEIEQVALYYTSYHHEDLGQQDMNDLSNAETYTWEYEMQSLLDRISEEADSSKKDSVKANQEKWEADLERCFEAFQWGDGSAASMFNSEIQARFKKNRCNMLAKELADIRGESFELPELFYRENSYVSEDAVLDITAGMENGSISITYAPKGKEKIELLAYDPLINENTISFKTSGIFVGDTEEYTGTEDSPIVGKITYGWDGAVLTITESNDTNLPAGTEVKFPTVM